MISCAHRSVLLAIIPQFVFLRLCAGSSRTRCTLQNTRRRWAVVCGVCVSRGTTTDLSCVACVGLGVLLPTFHVWRVWVSGYYYRPFMCGVCVGLGVLLPTFHAFSLSQISMSDMEMDSGVGRSYRYYSGPSLYPFGELSCLVQYVSPTLKRRTELRLRFDNEYNFKCDSLLQVSDSPTPSSL